MCDVFKGRFQGLSQDFSRHLISIGEIWVDYYMPETTPTNVLQVRESLSKKLQRCEHEASLLEKNVHDWSSSSSSMNVIER